MKTFKEIIKPAEEVGEMAYQMFGISQERKFEIEISSQQICQRYYDADKPITITDVLYEMEEKFNIKPTDESDLAYIMFHITMVLQFYYKGHGLKYHPPTE